MNGLPKDGSESPQLRFKQEFDLTCISLNKQLVALGEKDRLRTEVHDQLESIHGEIEKIICQKIDQAGGVDDVDPDQIIEYLLSNAMPENIKIECSNIEKSVMGKIVDFTKARQT